jgi:hypothetical protein
MRDSLRSDHDVDKDGSTLQREWTADRTPPSEMEKGEQMQLAPTASRGPTVHHKVSREISIKRNEKPTPLRR